MLEKLDFNHYNVHCTPEKGLENTYLIDLDTIKDLDQDWAAYSEKFIRAQADQKKPWFLYHCTRACHFDNYPNDQYAGKSPARTVFSDGMVEIDDVVGRLVKIAGRDRPARQHDHLLHQRQRPGAGSAAARPHAVPRRQGFELGRRRARADVRLLERHDRAAQERRPVRPGRSVQHLHLDRRKRRGPRSPSSCRRTATSTASTRRRSCWRPTASRAAAAGSTR